MEKAVDHVNRKLTDEADAVFEAIHAVMHRYRGQRQRNDEGALGLPHMAHKALGYFSRHPGATQRDLAAHSGRDKGQLARLVGQLRERGLLQASPDPLDRRNLRLRLTDEAKTLLQAAQRQERRRAAGAVAVLSDAERRQLLALLQRVQANLESAD